MIFLLYFVLFIFNTALQSLYIFGGDSAEFALTSVTWSIPHPPGYPLYSLIINLVSKIPIYTIPWRVALISNISAIITAYFLYKLLRLHSVTKIISVVASVLFLVLFPVWHYSLIPEVFTLNTALIASITYFVFLFRKTRFSAYAYIFSFLIGLSISHHHTFILFVPGWIFLSIKLIQHVTRKTIIFSFIFLLFGISFYLYAPIASLFNPPLDWENAKTIDGLVRLFFRTAYGTFSAYSNSQSTLFTHLYDFIAIFLFIIQDFKIPGTLLLVSGFVLRIRSQSDNPIWGFIVVSSITHLSFLTYTNFVLTQPFTTAMYERFLISFYYVLAIVSGITIHSMYHRYNKFKHVFIVFYIVFVSVIAVVNYKTISQIRNLQTFDRVAQDILATVPMGGIVYASTDNTNFPVQYYLYGLKKRSDVLFMQMNHLNKAHELERLKKDGRIRGIMNKTKLTAKDFEMIFAQNEEKGIYMEHPLPTGYWMPVGLLWKYYSSEEKVLKDLPSLLTQNKTLWESVYRVPNISKEEKNFLHAQVVQDIYREALSDSSKLFFIAKDYSYSLFLLERAHSLRPSLVSEKITILNIASHANKCGIARKYIDQLIKYEIEPNLKNQFAEARQLYNSTCNR